MKIKIKVLFLLFAAIGLCAIGASAAKKKKIGQSCRKGGNSVCLSRACDAGWGTAGTNKCVPRNGRGNEGEYCTSNGHCRTGKCSGLRKMSNGKWKAGKCSGKKELGERCGNNSECKSKYCDRGMGSVGTSTCIPPAGKGRNGDHCTSDSHCKYNICDGLKKQGNKWKPGKCHDGGVEVEGTVVDVENKPVSNVIVKVWDVNSGKNTNVLLGKSTTDSKGKFTVKGKPYQDKGDLLGNGKFPDVRVTFEVRANYTYPESLSNECWEKSGGNFCWRNIDEYLGKTGGIQSHAQYSQDEITYWTKSHSPIVRDIGKYARVAIFPARDKQFDNHNPSKKLIVPRGTIRLAKNKWQKVRTNFDPRKHGFNFVNTTRNVCWGPTCKGEWKKIFSTPQALCGGFSLTALKHYMNGKCDTFTKYNLEQKGSKMVLPPQLKKTIVQNQMETFFTSVYQDRGFDFNKGFDIKALKFLEWQAKQDEPDQQPGHTIGTSTKNEWKSIRHELEKRGVPVVIGLVKFRAAPFNLLDIDGATNNHQVLAIGYDYNPYYGSVTLYVYDPNYPNKVSEIRFNEYLYHSKMFIDYYHGKMKEYPLRGFFQMTRVPAGKKPPRDCR